MLESALELLVGVWLIVLTLFIGFCTVGSIVAALRAVPPRGVTVGPKR
jgi:hypothetical protein